jgi:hypothetical protein
MADYTQITDFSAKDGLSTGDPEKLILGSDVDGEFSAIATAISSKYDSTDIASQAEAEAETVNTKLMTPLRIAQWADANDGMVGDLQAITGLGTGGDKLFFFDDTDDTFKALTVGTGLAITTTTIATNDGAIVHDSLSGFVADEHVAHGGVTMTAGAGLTGGGTIAATRTFDVGAGTGITVNANDVALSAASIASLALADTALQASDIGSSLQAWDVNLDQIAALAVTRTSLGLGTIATQASSSVSITGGTLDGVTLTNTTFTGSFGGVIDAGDNSITQLASIHLDERASAPTQISSEIALWTEDAQDGVVFLKHDTGAKSNLAGEQTVEKTTNETVNNSTTIQDDDEFTGFTLASNKKYLVTAWLVVDQSSATPDFKVDFVLPGGSIGETRTRISNITSSGNIYVDAASVAQVTIPCDAVNENIIKIEWTLTTISGASDSKMRWAQATANASNTVVTDDSWIKVQCITDSL